MKKILSITLCLFIFCTGCGIKDKPKNTESTKKQQPNEYLILINKDKALGSQYVPKDLVNINIPFCGNISPEARQLRKEAAHALEDLFSDAKTKGYKFVARTGYRSFETQTRLWKMNIKEKGSKETAKFVAEPGFSEHQSGLAVDVTSQSVNNGLVQKFEFTKEGKWLEHNAHLFGFIIRYPKDREKETGYAYEPWHIRYVGYAPAKDIYKQKLILEQYLKKNNL